MRCVTSPRPSVTAKKNRSAVTPTFLASRRCAPSDPGVALAPSSAARSHLAIILRYPKYTRNAPFSKSGFSLAVSCRFELEREGNGRHDRARQLAGRLHGGPSGICRGGSRPGARPMLFAPITPGWPASCCAPPPWFSAADEARVPPAARHQGG
jgi:hypothetical protein